MQVYNSNPTYTQMFPMLEQAFTEKEFEVNIQLHVDLLNDLIKVSTSSSFDNLKINYKKNELYSHFFPMLSIAESNNSYLFFLDLATNTLKELVDKILKHHVANAYIKLLKHETNQVYDLRAKELIDRQEEEAAAEEEEDTHLEDLINEQYDAVFSFSKKSKQPRSESQKKSKAVAEDDDMSSEKETNKPLEKKYKESSFKKRKVSKLKMLREDKRALPKKTIEEKEREEDEERFLLE
jgi:hypothetical protein